MKIVLSLLALVALYCAVDAESHRSPAKVQLYSRNPGEFGKENVLICHVSEFHPPDITIQILRDSVEVPGSSLTDLAFKPNWHFHLTRSVPIIPEEGVKFLCRVTHGGRVSDYSWEPNM